MTSTLVLTSKFSETAFKQIMNINKTKLRNISVSGTYFRPSFLIYILETCVNLVELHTTESISRVSETMDYLKNKLLQHVASTSFEVLTYNQYSNRPKYSFIYTTRDVYSTHTANSKQHS